MITYAMRKYLGDRNMTPQTRVSRVLSFRGRREVYKTHERVVFYQNLRDPEMTAALEAACLRPNRCAREKRCDPRWCLDPAGRKIRTSWRWD